MLRVWDTRFASEVDSIHGKFSISVLLDINGKVFWVDYFAFCSKQS